MNKREVLGMCMGMCFGACVLGFAINTIIERPKLIKALDDANDNKDLEEAKKIEEEIKVLDTVDTVAKIAIGVISFRLLCNIIKSIDSNREFNEINFIMMVLHILRTDDTITDSDKMEMVNNIIDSGKFGKTAISLLKECIEEE